MRIPYGFDLTSIGSLAINENEAETVRMIFGYYLAGASLGKVVDMLYKKANPLSDRKSKMATCGGRSSAVQLEIYCHRWLRILHGCTV